VASPWAGIERAQQDYARQRNHHAHELPPGEPFQAPRAGQQQNQDRRGVGEDRRMGNAGAAQAEHEQKLVEGHAEHAQEHQLRRVAERP